MKAAALARYGARPPQHLVAREAAIRDRVVDAGQVLAQDGAGPQVEVADLRVAHLPVGEANRAPGGVQLRMRMVCPQAIEHGRVRHLDRVARPRRREPPAIEDHEADPLHGGRRGAHSAAAATIRANSFGSRLAPPTRAPSTSG